MIIKMRKSVLACSAAMVAVMSSPALATGSETLAGTEITNVATVNYSVGGVQQTAVEARNTFVVDNKINFTLVERSGSFTQVSPGEAQASVGFAITNLSNAIIDIGLLATQIGTNGTSAFGPGNDSFDITSLQIYIDVNGDGLLDSGDTLVAGGYLDEVKIDQTINIIVVGNVPINQVTGAIATIQLAGTAYEGGAEGAQGALLVDTSGANSNLGLDTVLADTGGNGVETALDDFQVFAAAIVAAKYSRIISDPINGINNPMMIPGAVVEYCIAVTNNGGALASNVAVTDPIPQFTTYYPTNFSVKINGTVVDAPNSTCAVGTDQGLYDPLWVDPADGIAKPAVIGNPLNDLAAGQTRTVVFQVTIQ